MACGTGNLGAALTACGACAPQPGTRRWKRVDRVEQSRAALGQEVVIDFSSIPMQDTKKRFAHVRGLYIAAQLRVTLADDNLAVSAYNLRALWSNMFLEDNSGHKFFSSIDGRTIVDDNFFRHWGIQHFPALHTGVQAGLPQSPGEAGSPTITADAGIPADAAGTRNYPASLYIPLATNGEGVNPLQGLIPVSSLQRNESDGAFRFTPATTLPQTMTGVTLVDVRKLDGTVGLEVWADVVYLPVLVVDAPWQLETYTLTATATQLKHPERVHEYIIARHFPNDNNNASGLSGQALVQGLEGISLSVAGFQELGGVTQEYARLRGMLYYMSEDDSAIVRMNAAQDLPMLSSGGLALAIILFPYRSRETAPTGGVTIEFTTRNGEWTRYLHRSVSCQSQARARKLAASASCDPCRAAYGTDCNGDALLDGSMPASAPLMLVP